MNPRLIVALDCPNFAEAQVLIQQLLPLGLMYKVGYEAYYAYGEVLLQTIADCGSKIMLDLKLHDIPRTVAAAVRALAHPSIEILTVHAQGGEAMVGAAVEAAEQAAQPDQNVNIFAVTVLTSISELELPELGLSGGMGEHVIRLAALARNAGVRGVVCSPHEARDIRDYFGQEFATLCPGIRPAGSAQGDQRRTSTPSQAVAAGAQYLVVGRPITQATNPLQAAEAILREMDEAQMPLHTHPAARVIR